jgi:glycosyltransferase involved in cell wall biosynthesis
MVSGCRLPSGTEMTGPPEMIRGFLSQGAKCLPSADRTPNPPRVVGRPIRVLAVVHGWFPWLAAGSERMLQHMLDALPRDSFEVEVLSFGVGDTRGNPGDYVHEGTPVTVGFVPRSAPDIIVTHHGPGSRVSRDLASEFPDARLVAVYHNERYDIPDIQDLSADLEVFNTRWVAYALGQNGGLVVHPPLEFMRHYVPQTGSAVTLVNLQENKGVNTFYSLAERMPDVEFLGVTGTHGDQDLREDLVDIHPVTQDMREVWSRSRVVLMPSGYESYGMVAAEACASGIPVIAHPTPGLRECLGGAGIFVDRRDIDGYESALRALLSDDNAYKAASDRARARATELGKQTREELELFVDHMRLLGG